MEEGSNGVGEKILEKGEGIIMHGRLVGCGVFLCLEPGPHKQRAVLDSVLWWMSKKGCGLYSGRTVSAGTRKGRAHKKEASCYFLRSLFLLFEIRSYHVTLAG